MTGEEVLGGGLANFGQVVRRGDTVERPAPPHAAALHAAQAPRSPAPRPATHDA